MAHLHPELMRSRAQAARQFLLAFQEEAFGDARDAVPQPHDGRHLGIALDYIEELTAMLLSAADSLQESSSSSVQKTD